MGTFATGVTVITTEFENRPYGMTANSLASVSLQPPLLLVCLLSTSRTARAVQRRGTFVVNILARHQENASDQFARPGEDHFDGVATLDTVDGLPVLDGTLSYLVCDLWAMYPGGDHDICVGLVKEANERPRQPLVFYRGRYDTVTGRGRSAEIWFW
jgi:flavin reductase (DIM6/NTAB) family NADH-FMN oxidoreductase RutF